MYDKFDNTYQVLHRSCQATWYACCAAERLQTMACIISGNHRHRLPVEDHVLGRQDSALTTLVSLGLACALFAPCWHVQQHSDPCCIWQGHSWAGAL